MPPILSRAIFQLTLPVACFWVWRQESIILRTGVPLTSELAADARRLGVGSPERVRLSSVREVPAMNPLLRYIATRIGLCSPFIGGMSLRYGIFIRSDCWDQRQLVVHELAHTRQYEQFGGIRPFLKAYLYECLVEPGY